MPAAITTLKSLLDAEAQTNRLLRLNFSKGDGPAGVLMVANRLDADEGLSRDFRFTVQVISDSATLSLKDVVGKLVSVELMRDDGSVRYFNGHVFELSFVRDDGGLAYYDMVLLPWLTFLRYRTDNYLFHGKTVQEQIESIFGEYPGANWRMQNLGADEAMKDAFELNESDYNYVHRRLESKGWSYHYEHSAAGHTLVITGDSTASAAMDGGGTMTWEGRTGVRQNGLWSLSPVRGVASTLYRGRSFDFKNPLPVLEVELPSNNEQGAVPPLEVYEYAGEYGFKHRADAEAQAKTHIEGIEAAGKHFGGAGDNDCVQAGRSFKLSGHIDASALDDGGGSGSSSAGSEDLEFLIIEARHTATNNYQVQEATPAEYSNTLVCLRKKIPWRPGRGFNSTEHKVYALQTAVVVGPKGEEIHTDPYGRVRVQFHWDRIGTYDEKSSAWIRVASTWAGSNFGFMAIPRIGQEVIVQWLDGNPDRPIITGRVYNQLNMPPWELPANQTQTGILSRSSNDGSYDNANALRFEDKKGAEELWLHAEKDQRIEVENDESHWVGHDRSKTIDHDETVHVKHDRTETVDHNEKIDIGDNRTEDVGQNETISIGDNQTVTIGSNRSVTIGGAKTETIALAKAETIGLAKALTIGGAYQTSVGALMNTTVGLSQSEQVGLSKSISVGTRYSTTAGEEFSVVVGAASLTLKSDGTIILKGKDITFQSSGNIVGKANGNVAIKGTQTDVN